MLEPVRVTFNICALSLPIKSHHEEHEEHEEGQKKKGGRIDGLRPNLPAHSHRRRLTLNPI
jgi:hypothetical protein